MHAIDKGNYNHVNGSGNTLRGYVLQDIQSFSISLMRYTRDFATLPPTDIVKMGIRFAYEIQKITILMITMFLVCWARILLYVSSLIPVVQQILDTGFKVCVSLLLKILIESRIIGPIREDKKRTVVSKPTDLPNVSTDSIIWIDLASIPRISDLLTMVIQLSESSWNLILPGKKNYKFLINENTDPFISIVSLLISAMACIMHSVSTLTLPREFPISTGAIVTGQHKRISSIVETQ